MSRSIIILQCRYEGRPLHRKEVIWDVIRHKAKTILGLRFRGGVWHIEKTVSGTRLFESTGTDDLKEARRRLIFRLDQICQVEVYGVRPQRIFEEAAARYLIEGQHKSNIEKDRSYIDQLKSYIGKHALDTINMGSLQRFIKARREQGVKNRTINYSLEIIRQILNLASKEWIDESNLTWLGAAPKIRLLPQIDERKPYSLSWEEQNRLFALFLIYTKWCCLRLIRGCAIKKCANCSGTGNIPSRS